MCEKCRGDCESCKALLSMYGEENLEVCEFCGHYYVQYKDETGFCTCTKGEEKFKNEYYLCMKCQNSIHISQLKYFKDKLYCHKCFKIKKYLSQINEYADLIRNDFPDIKVRLALIDKDNNIIKVLSDDI